MNLQDITLAALLELTKKQFPHLSERITQQFLVPQMNTANPAGSYLEQTLVHELTLLQNILTHVQIEDIPKGVKDIISSVFQHRLYELYFYIGLSHIGKMDKLLITFGNEKKRAISWDDWRTNAKKTEDGFAYSQKPVIIIQYVHGAKGIVSLPGARTAELIRETEDVQLAHKFSSLIKVIISKDCKNHFDEIDTGKMKRFLNSHFKNKLDAELFLTVQFLESLCLNNQEELQKFKNMADSYVQLTNKEMKTA